MTDTLPDMNMQDSPGKRRRRLVGLVGAAVVTLVAVALLIINALQTDPIPLGAPSGELAFISNRDGDWDIYTLDTEGKLTNLTNDGSGAHDYFASYAFDGEVINFLATRYNEGMEMGPTQVTATGEDLQVLGIADAVMTVFRDGRLDWDPVFGPDGETLVFSSLRDLNLEIYVGDTEGERRTRLTNGFARDWFAAISPDGTEILFTSDREGNENIYKIGVDGENLTVMTDVEWDDLRPMWSLEGDSILYISDVEDALLDGDLTFYMMDTDGQNKRPFGEDEVFRGSPIYTSDASQVVYMSNEEGNWHLYLMDADGGNVRRLTEGDADYLFPVWRPLPGDVQ